MNTTKILRNWLLACGIAGGALAVAGCGKTAPGDKPGVKAEAEEKQEARVGDLTVEQVLRAKCPHGSTLECAECRYEVGVVKVDPSLMQAAEGAGTGLIKTIQVAQSTTTTAVSITGEVRMNENSAVHLSPRIPGVICAVNVDIGAEVAKGDVLFTLDSVELGQALSDWEKNRAMAELSGRNFQREKSLYEKKVGSESDMIDAQMRHQEYQIALKASEQKLHVLGLSDDDIAKINPNRHDSLSGSLAVRAPISGTIIDKHAVVGELVEPGKDTMVLADLNSVWVWGGVYERDLDLLLKRKLADGIAVELSVPAYPQTLFRGQMNYIAATMDEATRTIKVRTVIDNKDRRLRPGMFCQGRILLTTDEEVLAIPKVALLSDEGVDFVFTHMQDDYYLRTNVKRGRDFAEGVEILSGLAPGQQIVTEGAFVLKSDALRSKMGAGCAD
ncbi:MAG: efflux RND transporter periplasmic adaptor subunit [Verrucomicrobiota bacterium]